MPLLECAWTEHHRQSTVTIVILIVIAIAVGLGHDPVTVCAGIASAAMVASDLARRVLAADEQDGGTSSAQPA